MAIADTTRIEHRATAVARCGKLLFQWVDDEVKYGQPSCLGLWSIDRAGGADVAVGYLYQPAIVANALTDSDTASTFAHSDTA